MTISKRLRRLFLLPVILGFILAIIFVAGLVAASLTPETRPLAGLLIFCLSTGFMLYSSARYGLEPLAQWIVGPESGE